MPDPLDLAARLFGPDPPAYGATRCAGCGDWMTSRLSPVLCWICQLHRRKETTSA